MSLSESLLSGILVTLAAWIITQTIAFFVRRHRVAAALVVDINNHLSGVKEAKSYVSELFKKKIRENQELKFFGRYDQDVYRLYEALQPELTRLFPKGELVKILKMYHALWELETVLGGFVHHLRELVKEGRKLGADDVAELKGKRDRIGKLCDILTEHQIRKLADCPFREMGNKLYRTHRLQFIPKT